MTPRGDAHALLDSAREILSDPCGLTGSTWARCVALLTRQALEGALGSFWHERAPEMEQSTFRSQLLALRFYVHDPATARHAHQTWASLSAACHHHPYELAPTATELASWLATVSDLVNQLGGRLAVSTVAPG